MLTVVMFVAVPGSGKSYHGRMLLRLAISLGFNACHLEQDMFFRKKNPSMHYFDAIQAAIRYRNLDYLILTKSNHTSSIRERTFEIISEVCPIFSRLYIVISEKNKDLGLIKEICSQRAILRGNCHTSLCLKSNNEIRMIINKFVGEWEDLTDDELDYHHHFVSLIMDRKTALFSIISFVFPNHGIDISSVDRFHEEIMKEDIEICHRNHHD